METRSSKKGDQHRLANLAAPHAVKVAAHKFLEGSRSRLTRKLQQQVTHVQVRVNEPAVVGTTNAASRLEGLTKEVGMPLVCSQAVFEALGMPQGFVALGERKIRGRAPMVLFGWRAPM